MTDKLDFYLKITGYGSGGEGVGHLDDGRVVFVRGAARGDVCRVAVTEESARSCRAQVVELIEPSKYRTPPDCPSYPECGGCDFRHITYEEELYAKLERVNDALSRIGKLSLQAFEVLSAGKTDGYRNKAVFHIDYNEIGFYRSGSHKVCPIKHCLLLSDKLNDDLSALWSTPPDIHAENTITLRDFSEIELDGLTYRVSPASFFQINNDAALLLFNKAREYAALSKEETLVDLYCGVGSLTLFLGRDTGYAVGVESNRAAIKDAKENARRNGLRHIRFICADAAKWDASGCIADCIVVDPPRKGLSKPAIQKILELSPSRVVYISCDPATMARDTALLRGYTPQKVSVLDMFPRTANVECCMLLCK